ncbi:MAG: lycopene cyclase family protein [Sphingomonas sp.]
MSASKIPASTADLAIVGGGPAGAAAALTLRRHAPGLSVCLFEAGDYGSARPGEVLPALARSLLDQLGVLPAFEAAGFVVGRSVAAAWADDELEERHSIFSARGSGWHLDRARFDRLLADAAVAAGVRLRTGRAVRSAVPDGEGWRLILANGDELVARAVIWATGRNWRLARPFDARAQVHDDLVAIGRFFEGVDGDNRTIIEARPEGWWYSADLPGQRRIICCMTDPEVARMLGLRNGEGWWRAFEATRHMASLAPEAARAGAVEVRSAGTVTLEPAAGRRWIAAGDTLFAADPLSSRGLVHALRSGVLAAYAAMGMLDGREAESRRRFAMMSEHGFIGYARSLADHYAAAARWPGAPFWQRRAGDAVGKVQIGNRP